MSAVAKLLDVVSGDPVARATAKLESLRKKLSDADTKRSTTAAEIETTRASLRGAVAEDGADPGLLASRIGKLRAEHAAAEELVAVLKDAVAEAEIGVRTVKERVECEALEAELRTSAEEIPAAVAEFGKHAAPIAEALSRGTAADVACMAIRTRLGLPPAPVTFATALVEELRKLHDSLVEKHGDVNGRGVYHHEIAIPTYGYKVDAPVARRIGIVG